MSLGAVNPISAVLSGTNMDEGIMFVLDKPFFNMKDEDEYRQRLLSVLPLETVDSIIATYSWTPGANGYYLANQVHTDAYYLCPLELVNRGASSFHVPVYNYLFNHVPAHDCFKGAAHPCRVLSCHVAEVMYAFNNSHCDYYTGQPQKFTFPGEERVLANNMHGAWVNFIRTGNPNTGGRGHPNIS